MKIFGHDHHHCDDPWNEAPPWAVELREMLSLVLQREEYIMSQLTDALDQAEAAAKANSDADDSAEKLLIKLAAMIADLKTQTTDPVTVARITALSTALNSRAAQLGVAVVAGTSAA